ncbi:CBS domain-containing protein, partial [Klebsiella pneumoniae]|uniref:CBS domain-containing protein n=1 Tax=Klebsiella pneumoniae TaxID=573 RepID=UPI001D0DCA2B
GTVCVVGKMRDLILQLSKSSIYSTKPQDEDREYGYVIERGNRFVGIVSIDSLKTALSAGQGIEAALIDAPLAVEAQTPLSDLLSHVGHAPCAVPVVDEEQQYIGIISKRMLLQALDREGVNHG